MPNTFYGKINDLSFKASNLKEWLEFAELNQGREVLIKISFTTKQRTPKQNNALWLWLTQFANKLNDSGLDMRTVLKQAIMIRWTKDTLHDYIIIPILKALTGKTSTTEMDKTEDIGKVWDTLNVHFAEKHNFQIPPWPHKEKKENDPIEYPEESNETAF
jgi:hypothetical protein